MSAEWHVGLDCFLSMGVPVLWAIRELILLRRGNWRPDHVEPEPMPRLPAGLVPPLSARPARERVLEDA